MDKLLRNKPESSLKARFIVKIEAVDKLGDGSLPFVDCVGWEERFWPVLPDHTKNEFVIEWSRGKDQSGKTKKAKVVDDVVEFNEKLDFDLRLYRNKELNGAFEAKHLSFLLKEKPEVRLLLTPWILVLP
jgi:hypothetical protein